MLVVIQIPEAGWAVASGCSWSLAVWGLQMSLSPRGAASSVSGLQGPQTYQEAGTETVLLFSPALTHLSVLAWVGGLGKFRKLL